MQKEEHAENINNPHQYNTFFFFEPIAIVSSVLVTYASTNRFLSYLRNSCDTPEFSDAGIARRPRLELGRS